jgi:tRNA (Thr-GGU) A37 N-methylase
MLKEKKGVLATRSPHRPNPVGVTLAKIERVDKSKRKVYLSACDLVDGTPILDLKVSEEKS